MITLPAIKRSHKNSEKIRLEDQIPAVYYGSGKEAVSISVPMREFLKVWKEAGETTAVVLGIDGQKVNTLIHEIQFHPITNTPIHIDFLIIDMKKEAEVTVPLVFEGVAEAEKNGVGTVVKALHEVLVKALPADLPKELSVDITVLDSLDSQIHVKDIVVPKGVTILTDPEEPVAIIASFKEEVEETVVAPDLENIEVEKKGKKEEEPEE